MAHVCRGRAGAQLEFLDMIGASMHESLFRLLGGDAPLEQLLEVALLRAINLAGEYVGHEPLALWVEGIAVQIATAYLCGVRVRGPELPAAQPGAGVSVRELLARVRSRLRRLPAEDQVAFALLNLDGRSLLEASRLMNAAPVVVRQRAARAGQQLLFAARRDRMIATYLRLAERLRALAGRVQRERECKRHRSSLRQVSARVVSALQSARSDASGAR